ncbi:penicillopepsin [Stachybotrys elegans]|uniref:Penicillopepsin n=1 Tax=Stachybotrys elegans TaxID=80388 RepID=A0A8K0WVB4_9HYPO|nr:penicillopepsin [Stachybotrys elegans]
MLPRYFLCAIWLYLLPLSSALAIEKRSTSHKITRVPNDNFTGRSGRLAVRKTLQKYDMLPDEPVASPCRRRVARRAAGKTAAVEAVPTTDDVQYLSPVTIGDQTLNLAFDTGSSDLWVFSTLLDSKSQDGHDVYDPDASKTYSAIQGSTFDIRYGDKSGASGIVGTDTVNVGGIAKQQAIEVATQVSTQFAADKSNSGLLGLGFSKLNKVKPQRQATFFENIMPDLPEPVFTVDLRKNTTGTIEFGAIDRSRFQGDMQWAQVNPTKGYWQVGSESFAVGDGPVIPATSGGQAVIDTGTTIILADPAIVEGYYSQVQGARKDDEEGGYVFPCVQDMPDLSLAIGTSMARVAGEDLRYEDLGNGNCYGGLQPSPHRGLGVYGDIFFQSQFVAFNGGNMSIGIAPHA